MTRYSRLWAPVAADRYVEPHPLMSSAEARIRHTERAVADLRQRLESGERPPVILVGPERGTLVNVDPRSRVIGSCHAWQDNTTGMRFAAGLSWAGGTGELVWSELDADSHTPDSHSQVYAHAGSVRLDYPTLTGLLIPHWLDPVGQHLADRYRVSIWIREPQPRLVAAAPIVRQDALTTDQVAELVAHFRQAEKGRHGNGMEGCATPASVRPRLFDLAVEAGRALGGLRVTATDTFILRYPPGTSHPRHCDAGGDMLGALARTVSFSILLSEAGRDYTGGDFVTKEGPVALSSGSMAAFTAATPHEVEPIESGERLVVVCFGMQLLGV